MPRIVNWKTDALRQSRQRGSHQEVCLRKKGSFFSGGIYWIFIIKFFVYGKTPFVVSCLTILIWCCFVYSWNIHRFRQLAHLWALILTNDGNHTKYSRFVYMQYPIPINVVCSLKSKQYTPSFVSTLSIKALDERTNTLIVCSSHDGWIYKWYGNIGIMICFPIDNLLFADHRDNMCVCFFF